MHGARILQGINPAVAHVSARIPAATAQNPHRCAFPRDRLRLAPQDQLSALQVTISRLSFSQTGLQKGFTDEICTAFSTYHIEKSPRCTAHAARLLAQALLRYRRPRIAKPKPAVVFEVALPRYLQVPVTGSADVPRRHGESQVSPPPRDHHSETGTENRQCRHPAGAGYATGTPLGSHCRAGQHIAQRPAIPEPVDREISLVERKNAIRLQPFREREQREVGEVRA